VTRNINILVTMDMLHWTAAYCNVPASERGFRVLAFDKYIFLQSR